MKHLKLTRMASALLLAAMLTAAPSLYAQTTDEESGQNATEGLAKRASRPFSFGDTFVGYVVKDCHSYIQTETFTYTTVSDDGNTVTLSAVMLIPKSGDVKSPTNMIVMLPYTFSQDKETASYVLENKKYGANGPSMMSTYAKYNEDALADSSKLFSYNNLVIIPDYQGFGASEEELFSYLNHEVAARQVVDAIHAGLKKFYDDKHSFYNDNWKTTLFGYSYGASVALATQKYLEQTGYADSIRLQGSICGSGCYDPLGTIRNYAENDKISTLPVALLMFNALLKGKPNLRKYKAEDFLTEKMINSHLLDSTLSKKYTLSEISQILLKNNNQYGFTIYSPQYKDNGQYDYVINSDTTGDAYSAVVPMSEVFKPEVMEYFLNDNNFSDSLSKTRRMPTASGKLYDFHRAIESNNALLGWQPKHRIILVHGKYDILVPYQNSVTAYEDLTYNGNKNVKFHTYSKGPGMQKSVHLDLGAEILVPIPVWYDKGSTYLKQLYYEDDAWNSLEPEK